MSSNVDQKLNSEGQVAISKIVGALPEDTLSMVWRSDLNEALRVTAAKSKRRRFMFNFVSPIAGLGFACALALIIPVTLARPHRPLSTSVQPMVVQSEAPSSSIEADLIQVHQDDIRNSEVTGAGLSPEDPVALAHPSSSDDLDEDLQL